MPINANNTLSNQDSTNTRTRARCFMTYNSTKEGYFNYLLYCPFSHSPSVEIFFPPHDTLGDSGNTLNRHILYIMLLANVYEQLLIEDVIWTRSGDGGVVELIIKIQKEINAL